MGAKIANSERAPHSVSDNLLALRPRVVLTVLAPTLGLLVAALFLWWELHNAIGVTYSHWGALGKAAGDDYDEGAYIVSAQLLLKGYPLFHAVFSAQPAFFIPSLAAVVGMVSNPIAAGHVYEALFGLITLIAVYWLAWTAYRPLSSVLAIALLAISPGFLLYAHAVEAEMPMLGLCTLSVAVAQSYYLVGRRYMAALSGLLLMAGSEMKLLSVVIIGPLVLLLAGGAWRKRKEEGAMWPEIGLDALSFILALALPALLILALLAPADQLRQVVLFHFAASRVLPLNTDANIHALATFLGYDPGVLLVALVGTVSALLWKQARYLTVVYVLWFLTTLLFLWRYHPLLQHQFIPLLPSLALLGAGTVAPVFARRTKRLFYLSLFPILVACALYVPLLFSRTLALDEHLFRPSITPARDRVAQLIDQRTRPSDFVICDDPMIALTARRLLAPGFEDPSIVRMTAGYLTSDEARRITSRYRVAIIVLSRPKYIGGKMAGTVLGYYLPAYIAWLQYHYHAVPNPIPAVKVDIYLHSL